MTESSFALLISDTRATAYAERLREIFPEVRLLTATDSRTLRNLIDQAHGLVTFGVELDAAMIEAARRLRWIQALSSGTDRIASLLAERTDVILTSARGTHGAAVSEMAVLLMLALARHLPLAIRNQDRHIWARAPGTLLCGKTVGIAGMGTIGMQIAALSKALGMRTVGFGSTEMAVKHLDMFYRYSQLPNIAGELDILVLVTPLRPDTVGMIDRKIFEAMKRTAVLVNVGRGAVVNEKDLILALRERLIAGAAIDAFSEEPLPATSPLWSVDNMIITPHIGGDHDRYVDSVLPVIVSNLGLLLGGRDAEMVNRLQIGNAAH
jgi:phosphoglycerate dehydrogenase-like enzyme